MLADLPAPLSRVEERYEPTADDVKWVIRLAEKAGEKWPQLADEYESEAMVALAQAALSYDPETGVRFKTFAYRRITGCFQDVSRNWVSQGCGRTREGMPETVSIHAPGIYDRTIDHQLASEDHPIGWEEEYQDEVRGLARRLPKANQEAFTAYHAMGLSMKLVAERIGISESRVSQIIDGSHDELRDRFDGREVFMGTPRLGRAPISAAPVACNRRTCEECGNAISPIRNRCYRCHPAFRAATA